MYTATSAPGHVTAALASAAPELDSTPINKLIDGKRSVVLTAQSVFVYVHKNTELVVAVAYPSRCIPDALRSRSH